MNTEIRYSQKVFEQIIHESSDSLPTLKSLSLVAQSWHTPSRNHLFRTLTIQDMAFHVRDNEEFAQRTVMMNESLDFILKERRVLDCVKVLNVSNDWVDAGTKFADARYFPRNQCHSLAFEWTNTVTFLNILRSSTTGFKKIVLIDPVVSFGTGSSMNNPLDCLRIVASSLETLCLSNLRAVEGFHGTSFRDHDSAALSNLRQALHESIADRPPSRESSIVLKRLCLRTGVLPSNRMLEVLLFESVNLNLARLTYLAIDSTAIALLAGRWQILQGVESLTIFDKESDYMPNVWAYTNKSRPALPALRVILGPLVVDDQVASARTAPNDSTTAMEYPGVQYYTAFTKRAPLLEPVSEYPRVERLHIEFRLDSAKKSPGKAHLTDFVGAVSALASSLDATLYSFLVDGGGPGTLITVDLFPDFFQYLPRTAGTGKIRRMRGDKWWDVKCW
ncbi:hypothetical protein D9757_009217 [Collybiopsis confluens]|uniref:Uncharacterized protein n=1 Tax=Collybiopsis confluens TaxID=2823264 RepID=A0A8H5M3L2_9AGAR|nr:hypothetical protein D9757_009217 [Collybiopsis confluens]